jgi:penicillin-binding protein 1C
MPKTITKTKKKPRWLKTITPKKVLFVVLIIVVLTGIAGAVYFINELPSPTTLQTNDFPVSTQLFDRNGILLYEIYADTQRTPVQFEKIPQEVIHATLAIEDADFYSHFGFSLHGIIRATKNTLFKNKLQGGSTITQQLVKTALLSPERTLQRKAKEAVLTIGTEIIYTKDEILEMYLNHIPYGGTAYGIEAASQRYFGKSSTDLNLAEASFLAGLPQAPSRYSPFTNPDQAKARHFEVLRRMVEEGYLTQEQADRAFEVSLSFAPPSTDIKAPHFVFYVKKLLDETYGIQTVEKGGLRVKTTLDLSLHEYAESSVSAEIADLEDYRVSNGAALITKPNTGEIIAMVGSRNYFDTENDGQVNLTERLRQPGSSIKPINYVTALQLKKLTPSSMILDIPTCFQVTGQAPYCPKNYDGSSHGAVQFRYALANSYNIPAVKVLAINSLESMIATASAMGISTFTDPSRYGLSLTLGGGEVTMLDMATAFGTLANQGVKVPLNSLLEVTDYQGNLLYQFDPKKRLQDLESFFNEDDPDSNRLKQIMGDLERVLNREPAYLISHILSDNSARQAAFGSRSELYIDGLPIAVKTGTTNDLRDNWTIGYTPDYVVATWVGNNDNTPMNPYVVSGVTGAAPIWNSLMSYLVKDSQSEEIAQPEPSGISATNVCTVTGVYPRDEEPCDVRYEYFWDQNMPDSYNAVKKAIWIDKNTGRPAFTGSEMPKTPEGQEPPNLDNLEAHEHIILTDPFTPEFCLDCNWTNPESGKFEYPVIRVDMSKFYLPLNTNDASTP